MGQLREFFSNTRRNVLALAVGTGIVALGYVVVPTWATRYGAWLVVFCLWMVWFVFTFVDWFEGADF